MSTLQTILHDTAPITASSLDQPSTLSFIADAVTDALATAKPVSPVSAPAGAPYSTVYAFGDSLTDAGNVSLATLGLLPVSPPYADRVFSDGPVWVQDLGKDLGLPAVTASLAGGTDFAYGGALTGQTPNHTLNPIDLTSQLSQFDAQVAAPLPNALYAIWIGSNDVLDIANNTALTASQQHTDVTAAVTNEVSAIETLAGRGAHNFVVLNVPDLGKTPYEMARPAVTTTASALAATYDSELATAVQRLEASGALKIDLVNTYGLLDQAIANPAAYGFTNVTDPAWTGNLTSAHSGTLSPDAGSYLFFDGLHPTAQTHALLADDITQSGLPAS